MILNKAGMDPMPRFEAVVMKYTFLEIQIYSFEDTLKKYK